MEKKGGKEGGEGGSGWWRICIYSGLSWDSHESSRMRLSPSVPCGLHNARNSVWEMHSFLDEIYLFNTTVLTTYASIRRERMYPYHPPTHPCRHYMPLVRAEQDGDPFWSDPLVDSTVLLDLDPSAGTSPRCPGTFQNPSHLPPIYSSSRTDKRYYEATERESKKSTAINYDPNASY